MRFRVNGADKILVRISLISFALLGTACGSMSVLSNYRNPESSHMNPAPESMSPPKDISVDNALIDETTKRIQADYHYSLGEALSMDENSDRAIEEFKLATIYDEKSAGIRLRLATEYLRKGLLSESLEQAEIAKKLNSEDLDVRIFLGGLYSALKMMRQASEQYLFVLKKDPENSDVLLYLGAVSSEQEKFDEAIQYFNRAAKIESNERKHLAYYYMGKMQLSRGEEYFSQAEKAFERSLVEDPDYEDGVLALSGLYLLDKKKNKAINLLERFQERFGPRKSVAHQLSQIYLDETNLDDNGKNQSDEKDNANYAMALKHLRTLESFEPNNLNIKVKAYFV